MMNINHCKHDVPLEAICFGCFEEEYKSKKNITDKIIWDRLGILENNFQETSDRVYETLSELKIRVSKLEQYALIQRDINTQQTKVLCAINEWISSSTFLVKGIKV